MIAFDALPDAVNKQIEKVTTEEALLGDIPDDFIDPITSNLMRDPVVLPSTNIVDRSTIRQQLLNAPVDPYNRAPMTMDDVEDDVELKAKIDAWIASKLAGS